MYILLLIKDKFYELRIQEIWILFEGIDYKTSTVQIQKDNQIHLVGMWYMKKIFAKDFKFTFRHKVFHRNLKSSP